MVRFLSFLLMVSVVSFLSSCQKGNVTYSPLETAHHKGEFLSKEAVQTDIVLSFGGKQRLNAKMILATNSSRGLLVKEDGSQLYFDQDKVYSTSETEKASKARFDAYTWSYFFLMPYKISDSGALLKKEKNRMLQGKEHLTSRLTFESGVGDAPEDWYVLYEDEEDHLLKASAYIVTAHGSKEEAEKDPHAIRFENFKDVEGIPVAHAWSFWGWTEVDGFTKKLGEATLKNSKFITYKEFDSMIDLEKLKEVK